MNILEGCRYNEIEHLVYASSSSVYGANTNMPVITSYSIHYTKLYDPRRRRRHRQRDLHRSGDGALAGRRRRRNGAAGLARGWRARADRRAHAGRGGCSAAAYGRALRLPARRVRPAPRVPLLV